MTANENLRVIFVIQGGIESAVPQAKESVGSKDATVVGGASTAQQCLKAALTDDLEIGIVSILLGKGLRFFDPEAVNHQKIELNEILETLDRVDITYHILN